MSVTAPWIALSIDWQDSSMFDDSTHGERLAWVCLLCHAKTNGRGGRVRLRKNAFATAYRLSERAVDGMLDRAQKCAAITCDGEVVSVSNWKTYQDKAAASKSRENVQTPGSQKKSPTKHRSQTTGHRPQTTDHNLAARPPRERDPVFESIVAAVGWDLGKLTDTERGRANKAAKELRGVGAAAEQVAAAAAEFRRLWPNATLTPQALTGNWQRLLHPTNDTTAGEGAFDWAPPTPEQAQRFAEAAARGEHAA